VYIEYLYSIQSTEACPVCNPPAMESPGLNPDDCPICGQWVVGPFGAVSMITIKRLNEVCISCIDSRETRNIMVQCYTTYQPNLVDTFAKVFTVNS